MAMNIDNDEEQNAQGAGLAERLVRLGEGLR
jgi:hypothetical protein